MHSRRSVGPLKAIDGLGRDCRERSEHSRAKTIGVHSLTQLRGDAQVAGRPRSSVPATGLEILHDLGCAVQAGITAGGVLPQPPISWTSISANFTPTCHVSTTPKRVSQPDAGGFRARQPGAGGKGRSLSQVQKGWCGRPGGIGSMARSSNRLLTRPSEHRQGGLCAPKPTGTGPSRSARRPWEAGPAQGGAGPAALDELVSLTRNTVGRWWEPVGCARLLLQHLPVRKGCKAPEFLLNAPLSAAKALRHFPELPVLQCGAQPISTTGLSTCSLCFPPHGSRSRPIIIRARLQLAQPAAPSLCWSTSAFPRKTFRLRGPAVLLGRESLMSTNLAGGGERKPGSQAGGIAGRAEGRCRRRPSSSGRLDGLDGRCHLERLRPDLAG